MPTHPVAAILLGTFEQLENGGALYQFTYGPRATVPRRLLDQRGLQAIRIRTVLASVHRITGHA